MSDLGWAVTGVAGAPHMVRDGEMGRSCPFDLGESIRPVSDDGEAVMATAENKRPRLSSGAEKKPSRKEVLLFSLLRRLPCLPLPPLIMHTCAIG